MSLKLAFPGCASLKEKRGRLQPILARLCNQFKLSVAETGLQDVWQSAWISCAIVSNDQRQNARVAAEIIHYVEVHFPDVIIEEQHIESR